MKNIHILPTDKPSRLHLIEDTLTITSDYKNSVCDGEVNIYITSDEEIKDGDWIIENNNLGKCTNELWAKRGASILTKKIILTTDQDLINDGVQKINDEFLEWFVKNPSCDKVEVGIWSNLAKDGYLYHIITPKEEPKQYTSEEMEGFENFKKVIKPKQIKCYCGHTTYCDCVPLEELKQERMYSEEDMIEFNEWVSLNFPNQHNYLRALQRKYQGLHVPEEKLVGYYSTKELFEKFKKK